MGNLLINYIKLWEENLSRKKGRNDRHERDEDIILNNWDFIETYSKELNINIDDENLKYSYDGKMCLYLEHNARQYCITQHNGEFVLKHKSTAGSSMGRKNNYHLEKSSKSVAVILRWIQTSHSVKKNHRKRTKANSKSRRLESLFEQIKTDKK